jgi:hypothetical protein
MNEPQVFHEVLKITSPRLSPPARAVVLGGDPRQLPFDAVHLGEVFKKGARAFHALPFCVPAPWARVAIDVSENSRALFNVHAMLAPDVVHE